MRRTHIIGATALTLTMLVGAAQEAAAAPFGTQTDRANFTLSGDLTFSSTQDDGTGLDADGNPKAGNGTPNLGESFTLSNTPSITGGSEQEEFKAIVDPTDSGAPTLAPGTPEITISDGPANEGFTLTFGYDRSQGGLGSETGTLEFTIDDVTSVSLGSQATTNTINFTALGTIADNPDSTDFYDDNQQFGLSFGGSVGNVGSSGSITGSYSATFSSPPAPSTTVPTPSAFALLGTGLIGLGLVARRRSMT